MIAVTVIFLLVYVGFGIKYAVEAIRAPATTNWWGNAAFVVISFVFGPGALFFVQIPLKLMELFLLLLGALAGVIWVRLVAGYMIGIKH